MKLKMVWKMRKSKMVEERIDFSEKDYTFYGEYRGGGESIGNNVST